MCLFAADDLCSQHWSSQLYGDSGAGRKTQGKQRTQLLDFATKFKQFLTLPHQSFVFDWFQVAMSARYDPPTRSLNLAEFHNDLSK